MKFKKLSIHNIASIEDAEIDFEHGPLAEDSRFLICGPTGAGKTTILDAICLVLYGTTPRLNIKKVEGYVDQFENFTLGKDRNDIKIDDTRMLMRRGSLNAFVELIFTDKDDRELKAVWRCSRAHNHPDGNIKTPEWNLLDAQTDTLLCSKKPETLKEISRSIGLSFEQFCRTTMLAQGDFTKFLKSDEGEKSQILEKLTGTDIYSEISICIHKKKAEKELICQQIASKMEGVQLLTEEERLSVTDQQNSLKNEISRLKEEEECTSRNYLWQRQLEDFVKGVDEATLMLKTKKEKLETEDFKHEQKLLSDWNRTSTQREVWRERALASRTLSERVNELESLQKHYDYLNAGLAALQTKLNEKCFIQQKIQKYLEDERPYENSYKQVTLIVSLAKQRKEAIMLIQQTQASIELRKKELDRLSKEVTCRKENVKKYERMTRDKMAEICKVSKTIETLNYAELLTQRQTLERQMLELKDYRQLMDSVQQAVEDSVSKGKTVSEISNKVKAVAQQLEVLEKTSSELTTRVKQQEEVFEKQQRACGNLMKEYRGLLSEGDMCPLCGQPIVHLATDEHFTSILKPVKELLESLRQKMNEANLQLNEKKAQFSVLQQDLVRKQHEFDATSDIAKDLQVKQQMHALFAMYQSAENPKVKIDAVLNDLSHRMMTLDASLKEVGCLQNQLAILQHNKDELEKTLRQTENEVQKIEKEQMKVQENRVAEESVLTKAQQTQLANEDELAKLIDIHVLQQEGDRYIDIVKTKADRYLIANDKALSVEKHIQEIKTELRHVADAKALVDAQQPSWAASSTSEPHSLDNLLSLWTDLQAKVSMNTEGRKQAEKVIAEADQSLQMYYQQADAVNEDQLRSLTQLQNADVEILREKHQKERDEVLRLTSQKETVEKNLSSHRASRPEMEDDVTLETLAARVQAKKDELNEHNQRLGKLSQMLENDEKNRLKYTSISKQLEKANDELNRWGHLHKLFGSNDGKKFRNIAQSYVLEQLLANANQYLRQFTNRYEMECQAGSLTILLRDKEAGGILRPTTTISGGESFLISLSLALGLSSLSRSSFSMDTIFIDEGFGTLDSTYLSSVMDALERLHQMGGKKIGIISHVESLKERLTTQIQVKRVNNTLSQIKVVSLI